MTTSINKYDLRQRTFEFAVKIRKLSLNFKKSYTNMDDLKQLIRSSGSIAANYIEAEEAISKKDFYHRIKICRKEAKESNLWIKLLKLNLDNNDFEKLENESLELSKIFGSIVNKAKNSQI